jgi:3-carboxy-cis,cis-muconate cycloisomerase
MPVNPADSPVMGALYGTDAMRAAMGERAFLQRMLDFEAALARAQSRLAEATRNTGYPVVGLVKQLTAAAGPEAGRWTHWGATTQDVMDTALVLQMRQGFALIRGELLELNGALAALARRHRGTIMAGRTHLQHALPVTFGYKVAVWLSPLITMVERLDQLRPRVERLEFGGAAGTLASLGSQGITVQRELAKELGLACPDIPWHVARDGFAEAVNFLGLICGCLSKIATDVILLMQTEVAEVNEPHVFGRGGSSTMPQKRNPISCEYIIAQSRGVHALVPQVLAAMAQDQERGTGPWQTELLAIGQAFNLTHGALAQARFLAEGMVVDPARMLKNLAATGGLIASEQVMMELAPILGRGEAHHIVNNACDVAIAQGIPLAQALQQIPEITTRVEPSMVAAMCNPENYLGSTLIFVDQVLERMG